MSYFSQKLVLSDMLPPKLIQHNISISVHQFRIVLLPQQIQNLKANIVASSSTSRKLFRFVEHFIAFDQYAGKKRNTF